MVLSNHTKAKMSNTSYSYFNLFDIHSFPKELEDEYIRNNITIDFFFGHKNILQQYIRKYPPFQSHYDFLSCLSPANLQETALQARSRSVLLFVIMLTGKCDANCLICCTDRHFKGKKELSAREIEMVLTQAKDMGCKTVYIPGEGEPLMDKSLWKLLDLCLQMDLGVVIFTNGLILSNELLARKQWGMSNEEIVRKLQEYNVYIYHKLWSTSPDLISDLMQIPASLYNWEYYTVKGNGSRSKQILIPRGLRLLLELFPRHRVGIETVILNKNYAEIKDIVIPFIETVGIKSYIEPLIHSGRCLGVKDYDIDPTRIEALSPWVSRLKCKRLGYKLFVSNAGYLSFGIQVPLEQMLLERKEEFNIRNEDGHGGIKNLFQLMHTKKLLVSGRYASNGCVCEKISTIVADKKLHRLSEHEYVELFK